MGAGLLEGPSVTTPSTLSPRSPSEGTIYRGCPQLGCLRPKPGLPRTADTPCAPSVGSGGRGQEALERRPLPSPRSCNFGIMLGVRRPRAPPPLADSPHPWAPHSRVPTLHPWAPPTPRSPRPWAPPAAFSAPAQRWRCCPWNQRPPTARLWGSPSRKDRTLGLPEGTAAAGPATPASPGAGPLGTSTPATPPQRPPWGGQGAPPPRSSPPRTTRAPALVQGSAGSRPWSPTPRSQAARRPRGSVPSGHPTLEPGPAGRGVETAPGRRGQAALRRGRSPRGCLPC